jgi:membrane fusion protein (multidrug efflux system)
MERRDEPRRESSLDQDRSDDREREEHTPARSEGEDRPRERGKDSARDEKDKKEETPEEKRRKRRKAFIIGGIIAIVILIAGGAFGLHYYTTGRYFIETDDAYTQADDVAISAQVSGTVQELTVTDNQQVRKGQVILAIDSRTYRAEADQAQADFVSASVNVANAMAQISLQDAVIAQSESDVQAAQAAVTFAQEEYDRYNKLAKTLAGSVQNQQRTAADLQQKKADEVKAQAALETERKRKNLLETQERQAEAAVTKAQAALEQAKVNLGYTTIVAPIDGVVGDRAVEIGQYVQPGTRLLTIVPMQQLYVVANYKETQLDRMHYGQPVEIEIDAYPGETVKGKVDSLAPGSGSQFALLPPENATGNFTKIVQRVPVKILIDRDDPLKDRLRPGLSVIATVDTSDTKGKSLAERPTQGGLPPPLTPPATDE